MLCIYFDFAAYFYDYIHIIGDKQNFTNYAIGNFLEVMSVKIKRHGVRTIAITSFNNTKVRIVNKYKGSIRSTSVPHLVHRPHVLAKGLLPASHPPGASHVPWHSLQLGFHAAALACTPPRPRVAVPVNGNRQELLIQDAVLRNSLHNHYLLKTITCVKRKSSFLSALFYC